MLEHCDCWLEKIFLRHGRPDCSSRCRWSCYPLSFILHRFVHLSLDWILLSIHSSIADVP